jgi:hypothetical protein
MEDLLKLLGLVPDDKKDEAQKIADGIKAHIGELDKKIGTEEKAKLDAIASRDVAKAKVKAIATGVGADVDNVEEAIDAIKNKKAGNDDVKDKEIVQLKLEIETLTQDRDDTKIKTSKDMLSLGLKTEIAKALPKHNAKTAGFDFITQAVEAKATYAMMQQLMILLNKCLIKKKQQTKVCFLI